MHDLFSLPIVLEPVLDPFVVSFGFWFQLFFFLSQFVFSADRGTLGLIRTPFSESLVAAAKDLIVFRHFNFIDIVPAHIHLRAFYPLFLDPIKRHHRNIYKFTGFF
jgi:hypothetical protein